jgi:hypothetical protein
MCPHCGVELDVELSIAKQAKEPEIEESLFIVSKRCPECYTHGHMHSKDCIYVGKGMKHHVPFNLPLL